MHQLQLDVLAYDTADELVHLVDDLVQVYRPQVQHLFPAEGEQALGQAGRPLRRRQHLVDVEAQRIGLGHLELHHAGKAEDGGEYVVEVMGDAACELSDRLHLLGLAQLILQGLLLGDVLVQSDHAHRLALRVPDHQPVRLDVFQGAVRMQDAVLQAVFSLAPDGRLQRPCHHFPVIGVQQPLPLLDAVKRRAGVGRVELIHLVVPDEPVVPDVPVPDAQVGRGGGKLEAPGHLGKRLFRVPAHLHLFLKRRGPRFYPLFELLVELVQRPLDAQELAVFANRRLVGGKEQAENLPAVGIDLVALAGKPDRDPPAGSCRTEVAVHEHLFYAVQQIVVVIGLGDEVVGPALKPPDHVSGVVQGGEQDDRNDAQKLVVLDMPAEFEAGHLRHHDVAQHQVRHQFRRLRQPLPPVSGHSNRVAVSKQQFLQHLRLGRTVFDDEDACGLTALVPRAGHDNRPFCRCRPGRARAAAETFDRLLQGSRSGRRPAAGRFKTRGDYTTEGSADGRL